MTDEDPGLAAAAPANLTDLLVQLRGIAACHSAPDSSDTPLNHYAHGYSRGWVTAAQMAEEQATYTAPDWATPLRKLAADLAEQMRRTRSDSAVPQSERGGIIDGLADVRRHVVDALRRANVQAAQAPHPATAGLSWDGYPKLPFPENHPIADFHELCLFLGGDSTSFTGDLLRLAGKADPPNLNRLAQVFPHEIRAWLMWRACAPVPVRTLVSLLKATSDLSEGGQAL